MSSDVRIGSGDYSEGNINKSKGISDGTYQGPAVGSAENSTVLFNQQFITINQSLNLRIDDLLNILKPENIDIIAIAYNNYLDSRRWTGGTFSKSNTSDPAELTTYLRKILGYLETEIKNRDGTSALIEFLQHLINNKEVSQSCKEQLLRKYAELKPRQENSRTGQPYLLVKITPLKTEEKFVVKAWLIPDDSVKEQKDRFKLININENQEKTYTIEEIKSQDGIVVKIIKNSLSLLQFSQSSKPLAIEVFLRKEYIYLDVHRWERFDEHCSFSVGIGDDYPVVVRSHERLEQKYREQRFDWNRKWIKLKEFETSIPQDVFVVFEQKDDLKTLRKKLVDQEKVGLKWTCAYGLKKEEKQKYLIDLVKAVLSTATPIAIWTCDEKGLDDYASNIDMLLDGSICNLPDYLHKKRQKQEHGGNNLVLLWEDPNRLTPDTEYYLECPSIGA